MPTRQISVHLRLTTIDDFTVMMCIPLWTTIYVGLMMNVVPGDDVVEACGDGSTNGEDESPVKGLPQQLQDFLPFLAVWQEGRTRRAAVPLPGVWMFRL